MPVAAHSGAKIDERDFARVHSIGIRCAWMGPNGFLVSCFQSKYLLIFLKYFFMENNL